MWIVAILIVVLIFMWPVITRQSETKRGPSDFDGSTVQKILESFQKKEPKLVPINTVYVNADGDSKLKSRIMFLDGYKGVQYDIVSDSSGNVQSYERTSVSSVLQGPYKAFEPDSNSSNI